MRTSDMKLKSLLLQMKSVVSIVVFAFICNTIIAYGAPSNSQGEANPPDNLIIGTLIGVVIE